MIPVKIKCTEERLGKTLEIEITDYLDDDELIEIFQKRLSEYRNTTFTVHSVEIDNETKWEDD